jgi:carboxymethylenebutenolidase
MCFDADASPPIAPIRGGSVAHRDLELTASDGNTFMAFEAAGDNAHAVIVLPDVRGLFRFYEELALRFAENGYDSLAIDYFGRTAGNSKREAEWEFRPHVQNTTIDGVRADVAAALGHLRQGDPNRSVFVVGFCFGGSNAWHMAASDLDLNGAVGFYGHPDRPDVPQGAPSVMSRVPDFSCPILALQGGDDPGIPVDLDELFQETLAATEQPGEVVIYEGAPHSFFDRRQSEYEEASADAWNRILTFLAQNA